MLEFSTTPSANYVYNYLMYLLNSSARNDTHKATPSGQIGKSSWFDHAEALRVLRPATAASKSRSRKLSNADESRSVPVRRQAGRQALF